MSLLPDDLKTQTFPCPSCGRYVNDEMSVCKFCSTPIGSEEKTAAILNERAERKQGLIGSEKRTIWIGLLIIGLALINLLKPTFDFYLDYSSSFGVRVPCLSPIAFIVGLGITLVGLRGYLREKNK